MLSKDNIIIPQETKFKYISSKDPSKMQKCPLCGELVGNETMSIHIQKIHPQRTPTLKA